MWVQNFYVASQAKVPECGALGKSKNLDRYSIGGSLQLFDIFGLTAISYSAGVGGV